MEKEAERFLQAEETAVRIAEILKELHTQATSYQTATKELDTVRQRLLSLIESTEKVTNGSYEVIKILKEIGGPEILSRITNVENKLTEEFAKQSEGMNKLIIGTTYCRTKTTEEFAKQSEGMNKLKILIIVTLASSITAVIIGVIALLR